MEIKQAIKQLSDWGFMLILFVANCHRSISMPHKYLCYKSWLTNLICRRHLNIWRCDI